MGRKSRIARGLDISAAARKMMEKALGTVLTDEEYFALEHQALKSPVERDLEELEEMMLNEPEAPLSLQELEVKPLTWEWLGGFADGEFGADAKYYRPPYGDFRTYVLVSQRDRNILENVAKFIEGELGIGFRVTESSPSPTPEGFLVSFIDAWGKIMWRLAYERYMDVYRICNALLPHLHLKYRIRQFQRVMDTIEKHVRSMKEVEEKRHRLIYARRYAREIEEIERLKRARQVFVL